jgi:hypothetical protein
MPSKYTPNNTVESQEEKTILVSFFKTLPNIHSPTTIEWIRLPSSTEKLSTKVGSGAIKLQDGLDYIQCRRNTYEKYPN